PGPARAGPGSMRAAWDAATRVRAMPVLLLVRHGETAWNAEHRWQGHHDAPLNDVGTAEAQAVASRVALDRPAALYSSDLRRARETAGEGAQRDRRAPAR